MKPIEQPVDRMIVAQRIFDHAEMRRWNTVAHEALAISLGGADDASGQREIDSGPPEQTREKIGAAYVGEKADTDLRHAKAIALRGNTMRAVQRDADSAAEHEPIDERNIRPDEFLEHPHMRVRRAVEFLDRAKRPLLKPLMQDFEIAAAREHRGVARLHEHAINVRRRGPMAIMLAKSLEHFEG
jgi:hypothetical protein